MSGPFAPAIISPDLEYAASGTNAETGAKREQSGDGAHTDADADTDVDGHVVNEPASCVVAPSSSPMLAGKKKRRKKEVVAIGRASAQPLPTPFEPDPSVLASRFVVPGESEEQEKEQAEPHQQEGEAEAGDEEMLAAQARRLRRERAQRKKARRAKQQAEAARAAESEANHVASSSSPTVTHTPDRSASADSAVEAEATAGGQLQEAEHLPQMSLATPPPSALPVCGVASAPAGNIDMADLIDADDVEGKGETQTKLEQDAMDHDVGEKNGNEGSCVADADSNVSLSPFDSVIDDIVAAVTELDVDALFNASPSAAASSLSPSSTSPSPSPTSIASLMQMSVAAHTMLTSTQRHGCGLMSGSHEHDIVNGWQGGNDSSRHRSSPTHMLPFSLLKSIVHALNDGSLADIHHQLEHISVDEHVDASLFLAAWLGEFERTLMGEGVDATNEHGIAGFSTPPHPSSLPATFITLLTAECHALSQRLAATPAVQGALSQLRELLLIFLQSKLEAVSADRSSGSRSSGSTPAAWSSEDVLIFCRVFSPLLCHRSVFSLCHSHELIHVLEHLHGAFEARAAAAAVAAADGKGKRHSVLATQPSAPSGLASTIHHFLASNHIEQVHQAFQIMSKEQDPLLLHRFMRTCVWNPLQPTPSPSASQHVTHFSHHLTIALAIEQATALYPAVAPWLLAHLLDIRVSLFWPVGERQGRMRDIHRHALDLSSAPSSLIYYPHFLQPTSKQSAGQQLAPLDCVSQQYHYYLHYLRSLLNTYASVREDEQMVLEYVRLVLCFSRPSRDELFRPAYAMQNDELLVASPMYGSPIPPVQSGVTVHMLPMRDSHLSTKWPMSSLLLNILTQPHIYALDRDVIGRLCAKYGFFPGVVAMQTQMLMDPAMAWESLMAQLSVVRQCLLISICCDDATAFSDTVNCTLLSGTLSLDQRVQLWQYVLVQLHSMHASDHAASIVPRRLHLRMVLNHMFLSIGSQLCVTLLLSDPRFTDLCDRSCLPPSFYTHLLSHAALRVEQQTMEYAMLESVDAYLWSDRSRNMNEQIRAIYQTEMDQHGDGNKGTGMDGKRHDQTVSRGQRALEQRARPSTQSASIPSRASSSAVSQVETSPPFALSPFVSVQRVRSDETNRTDKKSRQSQSHSHSQSHSRRLSTSSGTSHAQSHHSSSRVDYKLTFDYDEPNTQAQTQTQTPMSHTSNASALDLPMHYEDINRQSHWGMCVDLTQARCAGCTLPLIDAHAQNGLCVPIQPLAIFKCKHVWHANCMQEQACALCWETEIVQTS